MPILLSLLLAFGFLPLPNWLTGKLHLRRGTAAALVGVLMGLLILGAVPVLDWKVAQVREKLPIYQEHAMSFYKTLAASLQGHGIKISGMDAAMKSVSDRIPEYARMVLPKAAGFLGDGLLIAILASYFLVTMAKQNDKRGVVTEKLLYYGGDVQRYVAITAQTSALASLANFVFLFAIGVDFPLLWSVLYFFLSFIPNVGFIISIIPPILLALIMSGWPNALLVAGGLVLINLLQEYGLNPILMKKGVDVSFIEILLSLTIWSFLLGPAGAILAVPLTLTVKKFVEKLGSEEWNWPTAKPSP